VLNLNRSNRWAGVTNEIGIQLIEKYRTGSKAFLNREENEEYASHTIARQHAHCPVLLVRCCEC
jgi:hypothetical protein